MVAAKVDRSAENSVVCWAETMAAQWVVQTVRQSVEPTAVRKAG